MHGFVIHKSLGFCWMKRISSYESYVKVKRIYNTNTPHIIRPTFCPLGIYPSIVPYVRTLKFCMYIM